MHRLGLAIIAIAFFLAVQIAPVAPPSPGGDKIGHVLLYAGLTGGLGLFWKLRTLMAPLIASAFLFEGLHAIIPGRAFELGDIAANLLGILLGTFILDIITLDRLEPRRKE